jgi:predicted outer membrane lipoprotein
MTTLWVLLATAFAIIIFDVLPDLYYDHKRDVRRARENEAYRRMQLAMPAITEAIKRATFAYEELNKSMKKLTKTWDEHAR